MDLVHWNWVISYTSVCRAGLVSHSTMLEFRMIYFYRDSARYPHIAEPWQRGLDVLNPSESQLQHGLELHRDALALDTFGFLPRVWTDDSISKHNVLIDQNLGGRVAHLRSVWIQQAAAANDANGEGGKQFRAALAASGLNGMVQTVGAATIPGMNDLESDIAAMSGFTHTCRAFRDCMFQAGSARELHEGKDQRRFGIVWSANSPPLPNRMMDADDELFRINIWHQLGFRLCHLTYNRRNAVADGGSEDAGLSLFGREVIAEFNRVGMIVDVPHSSKRTVLEAAKVSTKPVMSSHAGCHSLFQHHRNRTDEEIKAIAETDGVVGIVGLPSFLGDDANLNTLLDHVMHAVNLVGARHVAIGTDNLCSTERPASVRPLPTGAFQPRWPGGWKGEKFAKGDPNEPRTGSLAWTNWPLFTVGMLMRGLSDQDIRQILGLNLLRVLEAIET